MTPDELRQAAAEIAIKITRFMTASYAREYTDASQALLAAVPLIRDYIAAQAERILELEERLSAWQEQCGELHMALSQYGQHAQSCRDQQMAGLPYRCKCGLSLMLAYSTPLIPYS